MGRLARADPQRQWVAPRSGTYGWRAMVFRARRPVTQVQHEAAVQRVLKRKLLDDAWWQTFTSDTEWRAFMDGLPFG